MNALELNGLTKRYEDFCLDHLNLTLPSGCIMGLVGENGAGKSTTIKLILGLIQADEGTITVLGRENANADPLTREDIGVVLDEQGIPQCMTPKQMRNVMALTYRNWDDEVYNDLLRRLAIPANKSFKTFSRGMRMKLGIAVALSHHPKLLLLDEATGGLDPVVRDEVVQLFSEFTRDESHAVLMSSHIVSDLEKCCDYIAFLHRGKLTLCEEKDALLEQYGILRCSREDLCSIDPNAIHGRRDNAYGVEVLVERDAVPEGLSLSPINLEDLFLYLTKEAH